MADAEITLLEAFTRFWNFQLFVVEGTPITLGKLIVGLILVLLGYFLARRISYYFGQKVISKLQIQRSLKFTLERLFFYIIYIGFVLFVLQMLGIPITVFTILGGALAIGIGFGSQNVVNNFISGLIVMVEQPVRIGDWVEIEGLFGQVEQIGSRSTLLRSFDSKQTIIPNSFFLEKMFTNWTLSDNVVAGKVSVGVDYGSDVALVRKLLLQAAEEDQRILKDPPPSVLFQDFADSSLNFDLFYRIFFSKDLTVARVSSDLRFRIIELFDQNGIKIPFPHRELLLKESGALRVKIESGPPAAAE